MNRRLFLLLCLQGALTLAACETPVTGPTPRPPGPRPGSSVNWRLEITNQSQASFGVRVLLDGESIYSHAPATRVGHTVEVDRPYSAGQHRVEFEILSATGSPSIYRAAWTVRVTPDGPFFHADGVPTSLSIGERLTLNVRL